MFHYCSYPLFTFVLALSYLLSSSDQLYTFSERTTNNKFISTFFSKLGTLRWHVHSCKLHTKTMVVLLCILVGWCHLFVYQLDFPLVISLFWVTIKISMFVWAFNQIVRFLTLKNSIVKCLDAPWDLCLGLYHHYWEHISVYEYLLRQHNAINFHPSAS